MKHPRWLQYTVAFFGPLFAGLPVALALAMAAPAEQRAWFAVIALCGAISSGFGGLVGLGFNDWRKKGNNDSTGESG